MKPEKIFLVRHGQSMGNVDRSVYKTVPDYALPLTDLGVEQACFAGNTLYKIIGDKPVQFYVSPFWRTRETYLGIITGGGFKNYTIYEDPRLREQEWVRIWNRGKVTKTM